MTADMVSGNLPGNVSMRYVRYWSSCFKHSSLNLLLYRYGNSMLTAAEQGENQRDQNKRGVAFSAPKAPKARNAAC